MEDLRGRGIKALPVTIIDDDEVIIGYFPKKLIPAFKLDVKVDLSGKTDWLADKYEQILSAASRATPQFSQEQLDADVPWRPWTGRKTKDILTRVQAPSLGLDSPRRRPARRPACH